MKQGCRMLNDSKPPGRRTRCAARMAAGKSGPSMRAMVDRAMSTTRPTYRSEKKLDSRDVHFALRVHSFPAALKYLQFKGYSEGAQDAFKQMKVSAEPPGRRGRFSADLHPRSRPSHDRDQCRTARSRRRLVAGATRCGDGCASTNVRTVWSDAAACLELLERRDLFCRRTV